MRFLHTKCGGEIDTKKRQCTKCKKKWGYLAFMTTTSEIRTVVEKKDRPALKADKKPTYAPWAGKLPGSKIVLGFLPNWPRWARILTVVTIVVIIVVTVLILKEVL